MPFPEEFWWGTAASSTQTEGAAPCADWARWEKEGRAPPSGDGNGFATRYGEDFALYRDHGLTHHRLSIEWARIEPREGERDHDAVEHYTEVLKAARAAGVQVWVCLHHFTLPGWFSDDMGGFLDDKGLGYFWPRHVDFVAETFGDLVYGWKPINEPVAFAAAGWLAGLHPPGRSDPQRFAEALRATHLANHQAWRLLRSGGRPVVTIHNLSPLFAAADDQRTRDAVALAEEVLWRSWIRAQRDGVLEIPGTAPIEVDDMAGSFDLIGFSYYSAHQVTAELALQPYPVGARVGPLGYSPWGEGLGICLRRLAEELPGRPLLVCELGVGTDDEEWREEILRDSAAELESALGDGIDVRGCFFWTGVDNYEWLHGFDVAFGLFDRERNPRPSAELARSLALR
ncbi:MAG: 6-phospho-beta-glucosidase GmuD [Acidimicrobiales bacterium]|nr:MAG: glycoside hydrolase family 1 protein [Actinomycetota bacterium]MBV6507858.1 6-phospho-beta-glucosidase GmuD [Acidimicrobiales bacterium]RIK06004.1 MAG: hypothetical protein DCC48_08620 [Acidobacteriota bacterium]